MSKFYIKTDFVPEDVDYITTGKVYEAIEWRGSLVRVLDDAGRAAVCHLKGCGHLRGQPWVITTKQEYEEQQYNPDSIHTNPSGNYFSVGNQLKPIGGESYRIRSDHWY